MYTYLTTLNASLPSPLELNFTYPIAIKNESSKEIYFSILSSTNSDLFQLQNIRNFRNGSFAKIFTIRKLYFHEKFKEFFVGAIDRRINKRVAVAKIHVEFKHFTQSPPKFERNHFVIVQKTIQPHKTLMRLTAK